MVFGSTFIDLHVGVARWRELQTVSRQKGVWDARLERETLILRDGRRLTYFLDGPRQEQQQQQQPTDLPYIFVLHAMFLSGNSFIMSEPPTDCVLVCVNRPGYFGSDAAPADYTHASFAADMEQLADHLQVKQIYVAGHSSGGPCALACAAFLPHRVVAVGLLSSDPEYAHPTSPKKKWISSLCIGTCLPFLLERVFCCLPIAKQSSRGLRTDYKLDTSPYLYEIETAIRQPVLIYVGEQDSILPVSVSRHVQTRLMNAYLQVIPNIGHLGLLRDHVLQDFFHALVSLPDDHRARIITATRHGGNWDNSSSVHSAASTTSSNADAANEYATDFHYTINNNDNNITMEMTKLTAPPSPVVHRRRNSA